MKAGVIRWIRVTRLGDDARGHSRHRLALVVTPPEWARGIALLIKVSDEYRDVGLLVTSVGPGGQAANAGIERGDVLLRYDGVPLEHAEQLTSLEGVPTQGEAPRQVVLEAVRGAREMTLTVAAGRLGITVSPLLHRLGSSRRAMTGVIRAWEHDEADEREDAGEPTVVEVPGELVPQVSLLAEVLQRPRNAKQRKKAEALLLTAAGMG
jgi:C-terminal processing protease CtpA/Prc